MAYTTLNVSPRHAELARAIAHGRGIPVSALIEQLIESCVTTEIHVTPIVHEYDGQLRVIFNDLVVQLPMKDAEILGRQLKEVASGGPGIMNLDTPGVVSVTRRGVGIIAEFIDAKGQKLRSTMGKTEAVRISDEIAVFFSK